MNDFFEDLLNPETAHQHIIQGSDEWDAIRCGRFTSSEIYRLMVSGKREMTAAELKARPKTGTGSSAKLITDHSILSDTAETYIKEKVAETLTGKVKTQSYAYPLVYGKEMEAEAVEYFERKTGLVAETVGFCPFGDHAGGSPDRFVGPDELIEIKCPWQSENQIDYLMLTDQWDLKRIHPDKYWQVMSLLLFTQRKKAHFVTYDPRFIDDKFKMTHIEVKPINEDFDLIVLKLERAIEEKLKLIKRL
jgi:hypothetical protein